LKIVLGGVYGDSGGVEIYTRLLADALLTDGHEVVLLDRSVGHSGERAAQHRALRRVRLPPPAPVAYRLAGPLETNLLHGRIRRIVASEEPDIFHATHLAFVPRGIKSVVVTAWDPEPRALRRAIAARRRGQAGLRRARHEFLYGAADAAACRRASSIVAVTREVERALANRYDDVEWIPPFLPDEAVLPPAPERSHDCVMIANSLDGPRKNLPLAVETMREVRDRFPRARLILVGDWIDETARKALPAFCVASGRIPRDELPALLSRAGCCILPSVWEEFGYVGLEALAAGAPLVCGPGARGFHDLDTNGVIVTRSYDPRAFASAVGEAITLRDFRFPSACRASDAVPRILATYDRARGGGAAG
jgi:glycosyltransferase involved in cell wall biosynthesis